jgi:hypothetical protein
VDRIFHALIGYPPGAVDAAIKTSTLFLTAAVLFRFTGAAPLAEFAPSDWIAAVAAGAIVGRAAIASDTSRLNATAALICFSCHPRGTSEIALHSGDSTFHRSASESADPRRTRRPTQPASLRTNHCRSRGCVTTARTRKLRSYSPRDLRSQRRYLHSVNGWEG